MIGDGLQKDGIDFLQVLFYVLKFFIGIEKGIYLVVDFGGINFCVCFVEFYGDLMYLVI